MKHCYIGVEFLTDKHHPNAVVHKFGRRGPAMKWLQSFETQPVGDLLLVRLVFTMPLGYRERKDLIGSIQRPGHTWNDARFFCAMQCAINTTGERRIVELLSKFADAKKV